jgi:hypothetical protein
LLKVAGEEVKDDGLHEALSPDETKAHHSKLLSEADFDDSIKPEPVVYKEPEHPAPNNALKSIMEEADTAEELKETMSAVD